MRARGCGFLSLVLQEGQGDMSICVPSLPCLMNSRRGHPLSLCRGGVGMSQRCLLQAKGPLVAEVTPFLLLQPLGWPGALLSPLVWAPLCERLVAPSGDRLPPWRADKMGMLCCTSTLVRCCEFFLPLLSHLPLILPLVPFLLSRPRVGCGSPRTGARAA